MHTVVDFIIIILLSHVEILLLAVFLVADTSLFGVLEKLAILLMSDVNTQVDSVITLFTRTMLTWNTVRMSTMGVWIANLHPLILLLGCLAIIDILGVRHIVGVYTMKAVQSILNHSLFWGVHLAWGHIIVMIIVSILSDIETIVQRNHTTVTAGISLLVCVVLVVTVLVFILVSVVGTGTVVINTW